MSTVTFKGNPVQLAGKLPVVGQKAPDFKVLLQDLSDADLAKFQGKIKVLIAVPSLDTPVCAKEAREFNLKMQGLAKTITLVISSDLPFAQKRFCAAEGIENVITGSQFRDFNFAKAYGIHIAEGPLSCLAARAVFVLDSNNTITYLELVPEITQEPNYAQVLEAVKKLL
jgi:thiol peroxidase